MLSSYSVFLCRFWILSYSNQLSFSYSSEIMSFRLRYIHYLLFIYLFIFCHLCNFFPAIYFLHFAPYLQLQHLLLMLVSQAWSGPEPWSAWWRYSGPHQGSLDSPCFRKDLSHRVQSAQGSGKSTLSSPLLILRGYVLRINF